MSSLAREILQTDLKNRIFSDCQLGALLGGGNARRYGLVNRALKDGSLVRLKRGTYALGRDSRSEALHPFCVAQSFVPGSYVSFESALAFHGWIPEAVFVTASVSPGRKTQAVETASFGRFGFHPLALCDYQFLVGVDRHSLGALKAFIAQPLRALMDLVALRKLRWSGYQWLIEGMRIDEELLLATTRKDVAALQPVYKHKAARDFLDALDSALCEARRLRARSPS
jgi:hypothetical protein